MSFGFTNIGYVCITQTCIFVNNIGHKLLRRLRFERKIIGNFKGVKNGTDSYLKFIVKKCNNLVFKIMRECANIRNFNNIPLLIITIINMGDIIATISLFKYFNNLIKKRNGITIIPENIS